MLRYFDPKKALDPNKDYGTPSIAAKVTGRQRPDKGASAVRVLPLTHFCSRSKAQETRTWTSSRYPASQALS